MHSIAALKRDGPVLNFYWHSILYLPKGRTFPASMVEFAWLDFIDHWGRILIRLHSMEQESSFQHPPFLFFPHVKPTYGGAWMQNSSPPFTFVRFRLYLQVEATNDRQPPAIENRSGESKVLSCGYNNKSCIVKYLKWNVTSEGNSELRKCERDMARVA